MPIRVGRLAAAAWLAIVLALGSANAATLRWANEGDVAAMDPYSRNETFQLSFLSNIYEPLIRRGKALGLQPCLATDWSQILPDRLAISPPPRGEMA